MIDLFNREVVGWSFKPRMTVDIVTDLLTMAWFSQKIGSRIDAPSGRGSQYAAMPTKASWRNTA